MATVKDISLFIDSIAPYSTKCEWDNCGVLVGDETKPVTKIGFTLDLTHETLKDGIDKGVDLIVTHHPIIFMPQKSFLKGNMAYELACHGISAISAHTCFDCAKGGVNDTLCELLGLKDVIGVEGEGCTVPMARIGNLNEELTSFQLAELVSEKLETTVSVVDAKRKIKKVALCGGAGMDFFFNAVNMGADAYITGEAKHHELLMAKDMGVTLIIAGHFETENPAMANLKEYVSDAFPNIETVLLKQSNPVTFITHS